MKSVENLVRSLEETLGELRSSIDSMQLIPSTLCKNSSQKRFEEEFSNKLEFHDYGWSLGKQRSIEWMLSHVEGESIIDIGGTVEFVKLAWKIKGLKVSILDAFPVKDLNKAECGNVFVSDIHNILDVIGEKTYTTITCRHTLEHSLNPLFVLWQINKALVEGGRCIVILPPYLKCWVWFYSHFNCLPEESWEMLFFRSGFLVESKEYGQWDSEQSKPEFKETRYILRSVRKSLEFR